ncbi:MAG: hemolysin family protein [Alphaproteobacteria bacterium]
MKDDPDNPEKIPANDPSLSRSTRKWLGRLFSPRPGGDLRDTIEELIEQEGTGAPPGPGAGDEITLMRNILNLHGLTVYDVMVPRVDIIAVDAETSLANLVRLMSDEAHSRIPVYRATLDDIAGVVHIKDVLACWSRDDATTLGQILRPVLFVAPSMPILELLLQMRVSRKHLALVVDEFGGIDGLVTIEDLVEEIVGEIEDEHDEDETPSLVPRAEGGFDADARVSIKDFEEEAGAILTSAERDEDIDTLGGLVFFLAGRVPSRGEVIRHGSGVDFEVVDADPRRVRRLRILNVPSEPGAEDGK